MPAIWDIMRAIRGSDLPATDRHILMTLASLADPESGVIPDRFMPSLTEIGKFTGLGRSTVARRMTVIETAGWIKRSAPPKAAAWRDKEKNSYTLLVPVSTSPTTGLVPEGDQSQSGTSPAAGHEVPDLKNSSTKSSPAAKKTKPKTKPKVADIPRPDVEEICAYLADKIEANGSKRPTINADWRRDGRLLLDEKRPIQPDVGKVKRLIDWCQTHSFWRKNVMSMPTLRKQWDRLRLDALDDLNRKKAHEGGASKPPSNAPPLIPADEKCTEHRGQFKRACGACRSIELAETGPRKPNHAQPPRSTT